MNEQEISLMLWNYHAVGRTAVCDAEGIDEVPVDLAVIAADELDFRPLTNGTISVIIRACIDSNTNLVFHVEFYMYDLLTHLKNGTNLRLRGKRAEVDITDIGVLLKHLRSTLVARGVVADPEKGKFEAILWYLELPGTPVSGYDMNTDLYYFTSP